MSPLLALAIQEIPEIIAAFKAKHAAANPGADPLTDEQAAAALAAAITSSVLKDDNWLSVHGG